MCPASRAIAPDLTDAPARAAYRQRLEDLQEEQQEAERFNDPVRIAKARAEIDFLSEELAAAYGGGSHARRGNDAAEKARKAITNRIRGALRGSPETFKRQRHSEIHAGRRERVCGAAGECG
jgi:hypothetical protein